jgi:iron complex outermembrane receptor protein
MKLNSSAACMAIALLAHSVSAQSTNIFGDTDLTQLPLEDLLQLEVTAVSRTPEKLSTAPAAVTVITGDDIRRSGATTIPDALRLVPGMQVAQVDSQNFAVSARGFNDVFANKLLVMIDGRTIYTPLFSGVFWDTRDTMLEDVDRIEVVRGPGATLWGANAVNGVINVITRSARDTQGALISGGGGTEERGFGSVRYGAKLNDTTFVRVYGKYFNRDESKTPSGADSNDQWWMTQGGFRLDWEPGEKNLVTFQGDVYAGDYNQAFTTPSFTAPFATVVEDDNEAHGANLLGRWTHRFSEESEMQWQVYYDETIRDTPIFSEERGTLDIDFQHQFGIGERNRFMWGAGFRRTEDEADNTSTVALFPSERRLDLFSAFIQDEIDLVADKLALTIGSKFEHNDFTGFEVQPSARLLWQAADRHAVWTAVSRAVRTPSRAEDDIVINPGGVPPGFASIIGDRDFDSEELIAYEIGYRLQPLSRLSIDLAAFYNDYDKLRSLEPLTGAPIGPLGADNKLEGETYGIELSSILQFTDYCKIQAGYSYLQMQVHRKDRGLDVLSEQSYEGSSPHHQVFVRSSIDFGRELDHGREFHFDAVIRYVDTITVLGTSIPPYVTGDLRLGWRPHLNWEFAIVGRNLLDDQHPEFTPTTISTQPSEIQRSVFATATWRF